LNMGSLGSFYGTSKKILITLWLALLVASATCASSGAAAQTKP